MDASKIARVVMMIIPVACSGGTGGSETETMRLGGLGGQGGGFGNVAHAAELSVKDASTKAMMPAMMPENPSHITLRFQKVPEVLVTMLGDKKNQACPYPYTVVQEADFTAVTLYVPQGEVINLAVSAVDEDGLPLGDPVRITIEPEAKLGTQDLVLGEQLGTTVHFETGAQQTLRIGETCLEDPNKVKDESIGGTMQKVRHGLYEAEADEICEVSWTGCGILYSFVDGPPIPRTESFIVSLKAGQKMGLYPVVSSEAETVNLSLRNPVCGSPEE